MLGKLASTLTDAATIARVLALAFTAGGGFAAVGTVMDWFGWSDPVEVTRYDMRRTGIVEPDGMLRDPLAGLPVFHVGDTIPIMAVGARTPKGASCGKPFLAAIIENGGGVEHEARVAGRAARFGTEKMDHQVGVVIPADDGIKTGFAEVVVLALFPDCDFARDGRLVLQELGPFPFRVVEAKRKGAAVDAAPDLAFFTR